MSRFGYVMATYFATMAIAIGSVFTVPVRLVWNASASTPIGLYALEAAGDPKVGELVAAMPPQPLADVMVDRGYIGRGVPLLKHVAALPEQRVCRIGAVITVDGAALGAALDYDRAGRPLPVWRGCRRLGDGELFLMNPAVRDSFDGRYFGPIPRAAVIGRATPLYTDERGDGRFAWRTGRPAPASPPSAQLQPKDDRCR